jgi:hypothetical protein
MDNGLVNLLAIVSMLVFCLIAVPVILILGTDKSKVAARSASEEAKSHK